MQSLDRDAPCPCHSGLTYAACCRVRVAYVVDDSGTIQRLADLSGEVRTSDTILRDLQKIGSTPSLEWLEDQAIQAMHSAGIDPAVIHAHLKTGRMLNDSPASRYSTSAIEEWDAAIAEWERLNGRKASATRVDRAAYLRMLGQNSSPAPPSMPKR